MDFGIEKWAMLIMKSRKNKNPKDLNNEIKKETLK